MPTPSRTRPQPRATPETAAPASRALPLALLLLALAGIAVAIDLWLIHLRAKAGGSSFCDVNSTVSCTDVARSKYSVLFGVPLAAWGGLAYLAIAGLAASALGRRRPHPSWPGGLLVVFTGVMAAGAVVLASISEFVLHLFCIMCAVSWGISLALFVVAILLAQRGGGVGAAIRADLATVRENRGKAQAATALLAALAVALLAFSGGAKKPDEKTKRPGVLPPVAIEVIPVGPPGSLVIYEYSDYLCPHCAIMHNEERSIMTRRHDVRFVRRHYPLDNTCNAQLQRQVHEGSCALARGGICAEKMGRFEAYDDLAFAQQASKPNPEQLAQQIGLAMSPFRDCMASPETEQRLSSDIEAAGRAGVNFTPSLELQGKIYSKDQLAERLGLTGP